MRPRSVVLLCIISAAVGAGIDHYWDQLSPLVEPYWTKIRSFAGVNPPPTDQKPISPSGLSNVEVLGNRKDGSPITLGDFGASPAPSSQAPAEEGDKTSKERLTAATPTTALEKTPADTLSKPSEKVPSAQPSEARRVWNPLPLTLSDIKAFVSRLTGGTPASSEASKSDTNSKKPASEQQEQKAQ